MEQIVWDFLRDIASRCNGHLDDFALGVAQRLGDMPQTMGRLLALLARHSLAQEAQATFYRDQVGQLRGQLHQLYQEIHEPPEKPRRAA